MLNLKVTVTSLHGSFDAGWLYVYHKALQILGSNEFPVWESGPADCRELRRAILIGLMMQRMPTVSKGRLQQVDSKMVAHVQGEKREEKKEWV